MDQVLFGGKKCFFQKGEKCMSSLDDDGREFRKYTTCTQLILYIVWKLENDFELRGSSRSLLHQEGAFFIISNRGKEKTLIQRHFFLLENERKKSLNSVPL